MTVDLSDNCLDISSDLECLIKQEPRKSNERTIRRINFVSCYLRRKSRSELNAIKYTLRNKQMESSSSSSSSSSKPWERSARLLQSNTRAELFDLLDLLSTICKNIIDSPQESKYRVIKLTNKAIQSRLVGRKGGIEFLTAAGFVTKTLDAAKVLQLDVIPGEENEQITELEESLEWLRTTVDTCIKMADTHQRQPHESCAEGMVQLRFPTGLTVIGGFARNDRARDVHSFACCFYHTDKSTCVRLRQSHNAKAAMDEHDLDKTLSDLSLFPRATLMVDTQDERERVVSVSQTHTKVVTEVKQQKIHAEQLRKAKVTAQELNRTERAKILSSFRDDRGDMKDREFNATFDPSSGDPSTSSSAAVCVISGSVGAIDDTDIKKQASDTAAETAATTAVLDTTEKDDEEEGSEENFFDACETTNIPPPPP